MKFKDTIFDYIKGDKFSNGLQIDIAKEEEEILNRLKKIDELVRNKKVIHLGCCDHIPLIKDKQSQGIWLHARITNQASECVGIDINKEGISYLKSEMGFSNVVCADITTDEIEELKNTNWDYIIIGEILEHVNNPTMFLKEIVNMYNSKIDKYIITVPNAFSMTNYKYSKRGKEIINTDHRFWFTPFTLAKIGYEAGLKLQEFFFVQENTTKRIGLKAKLFIFPYLRRLRERNFLRKKPSFRDGILCVFSKL